MIADCFLVNDELLLTEARIKWVTPFTDRIFIGEALETFSGTCKTINFLHLEKHSNVTHITIPKMNSLEGDLANRWAREEFQRDYFLEAIRAITNPDDVLLFCDVDEIPSKEQAAEAQFMLEEKPGALVDLVTPVFYRRVNWQLLGAEDWRKAKAFKSVQARAGIRYEQGQRTKEVGAHVSYLGLTNEGLRRKYSSFSHSELDVPVASASVLLELADKYGVAHNGRFKSPGFGLLRPMAEESLTDLQRFLTEFHPGWIGSTKFDHAGWMERVAASRRITLSIEEDLDALRPNRALLIDAIQTVAGALGYISSTKWHRALAYGGRVLRRSLMGRRFLKSVKRVLRKS